MSIRLRAITAILALLLITVSVSTATSILINRQAALRQGADTVEIVTRLMSDYVITDRLNVEEVQALGDTLVAEGRVRRLVLLSPSLEALAFSAEPDISDNALTAEVEALYPEVLQTGTIGTALSPQELSFVAPVEHNGQIIGLLVITVDASRYRSAIRQQLQTALLVGGVMLVFGAVTAVTLAQRMTRPAVILARVVEAIEQQDYSLKGLDELTGRNDEPGRLARMIEHMAKEIYQREEKLKRTVAELRIEIDQRKQQQAVAEITGTEYFQDLQARASQMRQRRESKETGKP